uniref:Col_cuticle_N domain-containing protein n=1 Tax=Steinernema glaseri TaxID=37863 RepID=A0A1I7ZYY0_9BILA
MILKCSMAKYFTFCIPFSFVMTTMLVAYGCWWYHAIDTSKPCDTYWIELKRNTTPGISNACMPIDADAEFIMDEYKMIIDQHVCTCIPIVQDPTSVLPPILTIIAWHIILVLMLVLFIQFSDRTAS